MIKMRRSTITAGFFALLLFWGFPAAYTQQSKTIALHPLQGEPEDIARIFFDELIKALPDPWIPYEISLDNKKAVTIDTAAFDAVLESAVSELDAIGTNNIENNDTVNGTISLSDGAANVQDVSLQLYTLGDSGQLVTEGQPIKPNSSGNFSISGLASGKSYFILTVLLPNYKPELTPLIPGTSSMDPIVLQYQEIEFVAVEPDIGEPDESDRMNWLKNYGIILPAFMCPAASLTNNAPYTFTGEVSEIVPGVYRLRLYLWDMKYRVQLVSDEMIAEDEEECAQNLPLLLSWMLSSIDREIFVVREIEVAAEPADLGHWLTMGLRVGGGDAIWYYSIEEDWVLKKYVTDFPSVNVSFQMALHILPWLALQPEVNLNIDASPPWETDISSDEATIFSYLTIPVLLKFNWRNNKLAASIFAGAYYYMPLTLPFNQTENVSPSNLFDYTPKPPGLIFGGSIGWKLGAGYLFIDGRFEYDGFLLDDPSPNQTYYRNMARLSIGYEIGLFKKRARPAAARETRQNTRQQAETAPLVREAEIQSEENLSQPDDEL